MLFAPSESHGGWFDIRYSVVAKESWSCVLNTISKIQIYLDKAG